MYRAPSDKLAKLLVDQKVPVFLYHLNTSVEALKAPYWRRVPHDTEYYFLSGAPFMDHGEFCLILQLFLNVNNKLFTMHRIFPEEVQTGERTLD
jgi:hypothetical protein